MKNHDMNRIEIANLIFNRINDEKHLIKRMYQASIGHIGYFYIDNLLPQELVHKIYNSFPSHDRMKLRKSLREHKYIAVQMNKYNSLLEEAVYAFQDHRIVNLIQSICEIETLYPDENLYAGGVSLMVKNQFLNPHLDNSHNNERAKWRVLNLLYYVSPEWNHEYGGNLELWPNGVRKKQLTIDSLPNRLVVMATHDKSWHSVSPISADKVRACVSNYYFSDFPLQPNSEFHVTSFRGRPEQKIRDIVLQSDNLFRQGLRRIFPKGAVKTNHVYKK